MCLYSTLTIRHNYHHHDRRFILDAYMHNNNIFMYHFTLLGSTFAMVFLYMHMYIIIKIKHILFSSSPSPLLYHLLLFLLLSLSLLLFLMHIFLCSNVVSTLKKRVRTRVEAFLSNPGLNPPVFHNNKIIIPFWKIYINWNWRRKPRNKNKIININNINNNNKITSQVTIHTFHWTGCTSMNFKLQSKNYFALISSLFNEKKRTEIFPW